LSRQQRTKSLRRHDRQRLPTAQPRDDPGATPGGLCPAPRSCCLWVTRCSRGPWHPPSACFWSHRSTNFMIMKGL